MPSTNSSGDEIDIYTYEGSPNVKVIYGYSGIVVAFAFFVVIDNVIKNVGDPKSVKTSDIRVWRNLVKSWIHALVVSGTLVYCYFTRFDQLTADPLYYCDYTTYLLVSFSQGYYSFDTFDNLQHFTISEKWEVHVHHFVILVNLLYILQYRVLLPYTLYSVIPEINTVFLHFRKLLQLHGWPRDHIIYRSVVVVNFITFIIFRFIWNILFCILAYFDFCKITVFSRWIVGSFIVFLFFLNLIYMKRLFIVDFYIYYRKVYSHNVGQNGNTNMVQNRNVKRDKYL